MPVPVLASDWFSLWCDAGWPGPFQHATETSVLLAFYRDLIGLPEFDRVIAGSGNTLVLLEMGEAGYIELIGNPNYEPMRPAGNHAGIQHLALLVPDLDAWVAYLTAHGVAITAGPLSMEWPKATAKLCFVADPEGNPVEFFERRLHA
ncbi:MAG: VOC family protein [Chloroflexi bacterium]|nr:VOC family protein [Chloroflexota bacterium]